MKIVKEFSRFAHEYNQYNVIQEEVAKALIAMIPHKSYAKILDLGAGSGAVYKRVLEEQIAFKHFVAFDFSQEMLNLHPKDTKVSTLRADFNHTTFFSTYEHDEFELVISASSLQWSENLDKLLQTISSLAKEQYFAFFTSKTFTTLHRTAGISSPIYSKDSIIQLAQKYYHCDFSEIEYRLDFKSVQEMFTYIKHSGVSGGSGQLTFKQMKKLMKEYPLKYLEFEVLFIKAKRV